MRLTLFYGPYRFSFSRLIVKNHVIPMCGEMIKKLNFGLILYNWPTIMGLAGKS
jgi:hypothetical protein